MSNSIKEIKKRDIVSKLHNRVINDLSNYSFEVEVIEDIAHYFDDLGNSPDENGLVKVSFSCGDFIMEDELLDIDFLRFLDIDGLESREQSKKEIEDWINDGVSAFCGYQEKELDFDDEAVYLEVERFSYSLEELNPDWIDDKYSIDDEKLKDFIEEVFSSEGYTVNDLNF